MVECVVNGITFATLIEKHNVQTIDLLQLDAEGYDFEIIQSIPFTKVIPSIIRYEHKHIDNAECRQYLEQFGYEFLHEKHDTVAYLGKYLLK